MKRIAVLTALIAAGAVSYVVAQQGGQKPMVVEVQKLKDNLFVLTGEAEAATPPSSSSRTASPSSIRRTPVGARRFWRKSRS